MRNILISNIKYDKRKDLKDKDVLLIIEIFLLVLFAFWKITQGIHSDEAYSIALGDMLVDGNAFFKENWSSLQMSAVFIAPLIHIYKICMGGGKDGILLFFRIISVLVQLGISTYFYNTFKRRYNKYYVLIASVILFTFVPDAQSFTYKTEILWFSVMEIIFAYRYFESKKLCYVVLLGIMIAGGVLAYPTAIIGFPIWLLILWLLPQEIQNVKIKIQVLVTLAVSCALCACIFGLIVFRQISIYEFITFFPKVFQDKNLNLSFGNKLLHPIIKFLVMGIFVSIPILIYMKFEKSRKIKKFSLPLTSILLLSAFLLQCYVERRGVTWHCLTYPYVLTSFIILIIYFLFKEEKNKNRIIILLFEVPSLALCFCMALASNQGNITSMYGTVITAMALCLMLGNINGKEIFIIKEKRWITKSLCIFSILMYCTLVYEQESVNVDSPDFQTRTIFSERNRIEKGAAKGLYFGNYNYKNYVVLCDVVTKNVTEKDSLFCVDSNEFAPYGYLCSNGSYATFSPQGGAGILDSKQSVEYFEKNPARNPTIIIVNSDYVGKDYEELFHKSCIGQYVLNNNYFIKCTQEQYVVYCKDNIN